jgi:hypothetical protein
LRRALAGAAELAASKHLATVALILPMGDGRDLVVDF